MKTIYALIALAIFSPYAIACTNLTPYVVTGESLVAVGNQFADVGEAMNKGLDAGKVTPEQYRTWAAFGKRFQVLYPATVNAWSAALEANDKALQGDLAGAVARLTAELAGFVDVATRLGLLRGAP